MVRAIPALEDWSLIRSFLAVAEHGSLSAAARVLGSSQPTLGRQIRALQAELGIEIFHRRERGLVLSDAGAALLPAARAMRQALHDIELTAQGKEQTLEGTVRITSSIITATHHLPRIIVSLRSAAPRVQVELVASDETSNLHFGEADIAVRMYRPKQLDLVTLFLGHLSLGLFAAKSYAERRGLPGTASELSAHEVLGFDRNAALIEGFAAAGFPVTRDWFKVRCDAPNTYWELVRAGVGLGFTQSSIGRADPEVVEVPLELPLPRLPVYLSAHESIRHTPRVRTAWEHLAKGLSEVIERDTMLQPAPGAPEARRSR